MSQQSRTRLIMLALSGFLFGATVYGWMDYANRSARVANIENTSGGAAANAAGNGSSANCAQQGQVPATTGLVAMAQAKQDAGRADPMQPFFVATNRSNSAYQYYAPIGPMVVPPPPDVYPSAPAVAPAAATKPEPGYCDRPLHEVVKLVGLIDGKAIFCIPPAYARDKNLPYAFSLSRGEQLYDLQLESVTSDSATLRDGKKICIKQLGPIR
jgi:hypothetical protein